MIEFGLRQAERSARVRIVHKYLERGAKHNTEGSVTILIREQGAKQLRQGQSQKGIFMIILDSFGRDKAPVWTYRETKSGSYLCSSVALLRHRRRRRYHHFNL